MQSEYAELRPWLRLTMAFAAWLRYGYDREVAFEIADRFLIVFEEDRIPDHEAQK